ncbi:hypothetical protein EIP91_001447 [Steccherinum ochraceum]|uniref:Oxidase ustYa n=1 Tax=Steccherinum ochraceum TaxID=92696 RepID=A0A4R0RHS0_9APHY|nr:hypothetical protein EIP91_001447 [Steccherinum ochraceum]
MTQSASFRSHLPAFFFLTALICVALVLISRNDAMTVFIRTASNPDLPLHAPVSLKDRLHKMNGDPRFSLHSDDEWAALIPQPDKGFVSLGPDNQPYVVALYHQLHCLDSFRRALLLNDTEHAGHFEHCLKYLRQTLICHADVTLEAAHWVVDDDGINVAVTTGIGVTHACKDWDQLFTWVLDRPLLFPEL